ncbi:hypothetical protein [Streptomyces albogriseolus]|uniref:hypothetical protein n=1 Tax=Streptomyces albogriseolus TaxID=1887 RepID=UPI00385034EB
MEGWKFWWGVAAFFLGGLATQLNGWLTYRRQRRDRAEDAEDALRQRREEFELQHLVEVHQLLQQLNNALLDCASTQRLAAMGIFAGDELAERIAVEQAAFNAAQVALHAQMGFILDDEVRRLVQEAEDAIDDEQAHTLLEELVESTATGQKVRAATDAIGARIRALYAGRAGS